MIPAVTTTYIHHHTASVARLLTIVMMAAVLFSCHKDDDPLPQPTRTVLVYMVAENSLVSYTTADIQEMMQGASQMGDGDHLVIYIDDVSTPRIYALDNQSVLTSTSQMQPVKVFSYDPNSASGETLDQVIQYTRTTYPADTYGIVFWSHGAGWIYDTDTSDISAPRRQPLRRTFGVDNGQNTTSNVGPKMNIDDMAATLEQYDNTEFIMFDACFMQTIEVAYEMRNTARYLIGSPAEILAYGAPYHKIMAPLFAKPFSPENLVYTYYNYYDTYYSYGVVLSAIQTDQLDQLATTMARLIDAHSWLDTDYSDCLNYYRYWWNDFPQVLTRMPDYFDMKGLMQKVLTVDELAQWQNAMQRAVVSCHASDNWYTAIGDGGYGQVMSVNHDQCSGVAMYLPLADYQYETFYNDYKKTQWGQLFNIK